jgi:hypothetical protein
MARKLKTYQTSLGFFDLAIAAPSMKAALEAWGADSNLFHQGAEGKRGSARRRRDHSGAGRSPERPVGTKGSLGEHAELPTGLGRGAKPAKAARKSAVRKPVKPSRPHDAAAERKAALDYEREEGRRERAKEETAAQKARARRQHAVDKAQAAFDAAESEHAKRAAVIESERETIDKKSQAEDDRWDNERERLQAALRRARG